MLDPLRGVWQHRLSELKFIELIVQKYYDNKICHFPVILLVKQVLENKFVFSLEFFHVDVDSSTQTQAIFELVETNIYLRFK